MGNEMKQRVMLMLAYLLADGDTEISFHTYIDNNLFPRRLTVSGDDIVVTIEDADAGANNQAYTLQLHVNEVVPA